MKIKTFPLQFTEEKLNEIEQYAGKGNKKQFILDAIEEKISRIKRDTEARR